MASHLVLAENQTGDFVGDWMPWDGGFGMFQGLGTFGTGTPFLLCEYQGIDGSTSVTVGVLSAAGVIVSAVPVPPGQVRAQMFGSTAASGLYAGITRVPGGSTMTHVPLAEDESTNFTGDWKQWPGGRALFQGFGTFGGGNLRLQILGVDSSTPVTVITRTDSGANEISLGACQMRSILEGATSPAGMHAAVTGVPG